MKRTIIYSLTFIGLLLFTGCTKNAVPGDEQVLKTIDHALLVAQQQYKQMEPNVSDSLFPRTLVEEKVKFVNRYDWTSGFYPATLWYLYQYSGDTLFRDAAKKHTAFLEPLKHFKGTHDLGFMIYCPYGNGLKKTNDSSYKQVIIEGSKSLISRFNPNVGLVKSWDGNHWQYPVIIDNMMNLEMLCEATRLSGDSLFYKIAVSHANKTLANHFRPDYSTFHLVDYDSVSGKVIKKQTVQGFADSSAWARGQSWGLYGYTMMFRETHDSSYLIQAIHIADFLINHPNLPADAIPYWDYNAPQTPDCPRDVAAAAIMASALIELSDLSGNHDFFNHAKRIIQSLGSEAYLAKPGTNGHFILMHATGHLPANSEIDVPLIYADYYFVEAMLSMRDKLIIKRL